MYTKCILNAILRMCLMQSHLELAGPAVVPDMMYATLDIFNPHNAKLLAATAAGMPCLLLNPVSCLFHLLFHLPRHLFPWLVCLTADKLWMLCHARPCYAMLCCAMLCYPILCYAMLCYAMLCYAMLCYAMLYYAMLCYAMLCCHHATKLAATAAGILLPLHYFGSMTVLGCSPLTSA